MTLADLDGDGHLDVATSNFGDTFRGECISVLHGLGDGSFGPAQVYYALFSLSLGNPAGIAAGDVDGDGDLDLVAGAYAADDVVVLRNRGDGAFEPQERYGVNGVVRGVVLADLDGDFRLDVGASIGLEPPIESAVSVMLGLPGAPDGSFPVCFGDGSGGPCGCGNQGAAGEGCGNSLGMGAVLSASGNASLSGDTFVLAAVQTPLQPGLFFQGNVALDPPPNFGDGLRCCGTDVVRIGTYLPSGNATNTSTGDLIGGVGGPIASHPGNADLSAGDSRCYQWWFRDPAGPCGAGFNLSNAVLTTWGP